MMLMNDVKASRKVKHSGIRSRAKDAKRAGRPDLYLSPVGHDQFVPRIFLKGRLTNGRNVEEVSSHQ